MIVRLMAEHRIIEGQAAQLGELASAGGSAGAVDALRWQLCCALLAHCANEEREIHDRLIVSGDTALMRLAARSYREMGGLGEEFLAYVSDWPAERIADDWPGFDEVTRAVLARLSERIAHEEAELYPAVERLANRRAA